MTGEGGSGGALALAAADRVLMLENSYYSVISPEGCATILFKDAAAAPRAAAALRITAPDLLRLGVMDAVVPEPARAPTPTTTRPRANLKTALVAHPAASCCRCRRRTAREALRPLPAVRHPRPAAGTPADRGEGDERRQEHDRVHLGRGEGPRPPARGDHRAALRREGGRIRDRDRARRKLDRGAAAAGVVSRAGPEGLLGVVRGSVGAATRAPTTGSRCWHRSSGRSTSPRSRAPRRSPRSGTWSRRARRSASSRR